MTKSYAQDLADSIYAARELDRITDAFKRNPDAAIQSSLSPRVLESLGFSVVSTYQGTMVSLPRNSYSQFGDH